MTFSDSRIRLVVLDWAGTTVDFGSRAPAIAFRKVFESEGISVTDAEIRKPMGLNKRQHLISMLSESDIATRWETEHGSAWTEADVDRMYADFVPFQLEAIRETSEPVPGLIETLAELRSRGIAIVGTTGYFREAADSVAELAGSHGYTPDVNLCADDVREGRPAPWMIFEGMQRTGVYPATSVLKVGDTVADISAGRAAGCWSVGVVDSSSVMGLSRAEYENLTDAGRTTHQKRCEQMFAEAGADAVITTIADVPQLIERIETELKHGHRPGRDVLTTSAP